ncbi:MAG: SDR family NAD(P)-dependent oxidoreductase [Lachnospiraceae bacterium]|nr:SDR family NAD(P)-dependent oxidoreductase [Lachnospiraceae bacterium]
MKIALVTGASSGIGRELAIEIALHCTGLNEIWAVARRGERLEELRRTFGKRIRIFALDLNSDSGLMELREELLEKRPDVRILVNSAGMGIIGNIAETPVPEILSMVKLNVEALTAVTCMLLPFMGRGGRIVNIASGSAFMPQPGFGVYAATKAYVLSFSRALKRELSNRKISVTTVCPGPVKTEFFKQAEKHRKMAGYKRAFMADPTRVAKKAFMDMKKRKSLSIYGFAMKAGFFFMKILPHELLLRFFKV